MTRLAITPMPFSLEFNGTNQEAATVDNIGLSGAAACSIGGWIKPLTPSGNNENDVKPLFVGGKIDTGAGNGPFTLYQVRDDSTTLNQVFFGLFDNIATRIDEVLTPQEWVHIMVTIQGGVNGVNKCYINGVLQAETQILTPAISDGPVSIGGFFVDAFAQAFYINARYGPTCFYTRELTAAEVLGIARGQIYPSTGLWGKWMMTDGSGAQITDSSGNGHHMTAVNSPSWVSSDTPVRTRNPVV